MAQVNAQEDVLQIGYTYLTKQRMDDLCQISPIKSFLFIPFKRNDKLLICWLLPIVYFSFIILPMIPELFNQTWRSQNFGDSNFVEPKFKILLCFCLHAYFPNDWFDLFPDNIIILSHFSRGLGFTTLGITQSSIEHLYYQTRKNNMCQEIRRN